MATISDLYEEVKSRYHVDKKLGTVSGGVIRQALARALEIPPATFKNCQSFAEMMDYITLFHDDKLHEEKTPDEVEKIQTKFNSIVKLANIKPR